MFRSVFALFGFLAFMPFIIEAATIGFVSSSGVWFSADPPFSGVAVKTYSVVLNNEYKQLTATIAFADNGQEFGRTTIVVPQEEARQIQVIWTPTYGKHTIAAKFVSAFVIDSSGNTKQLSQSEMDSFAPPISQSIDIDNDSDKDGIGDHTEISTYGTAPLKADTDDDGLNDYDEIFKYKTDPKKANTDGDGMNDGDEVRAGRNPLVQDDPPPPPAPPTAAAPSSGGQTVVVQESAKQQKQPAVPKQTAQTQTQLQTQLSQQQKTAAESAAKKKAAVASQVKPTTDDAVSVALVATTTPAAQTTSTELIAPPTQQTNSNQTDEDDTRWVTVLGTVAGLLAVAAAVSGALAWREKNRY